ncbi:MAG: DUF3078 domain-containing protein [Paramuribaculum sp.]|nr:DUF3078 domain-containing protein [Paramuribaculum sp.]
MRKSFCLLTTVLISILSASYSSAQNVDIFRLGAKSAQSVRNDTLVILPWFDEEIGSDVCLLDSANIEPDTVITSPLRHMYNIPVATYGAPIVYDYWQILDSLELMPKKRPAVVGETFDWIDDLNFGYLLYNRARQNFIANNPEMVKYNIRNLPEPPAHYNAFVDPVTTRIVLQEQISSDDKESVNNLLNVKRINWLQKFDALAMFSQAYISPNWYQGGNRSLTAILNLVYNVKLNQKFYPKLLFETNISYKLGINSSPDDTIRSYNISEDLFQLNSKFGYKAFRRWYYSTSVQFKTQLLQSYNTNSTTLRSAFMSPSQTNVGVGMTYEYTNKRKTFTFNASIDPLSWQLVTCFSSRMNRAAYNIDPGHHTVNTFGSSGEYKLNWKLAYNISYNSRLFVFTDYERFQADWEHTIKFTINRYLSTQIFAHMRYDSSTPRVHEGWHKFQFKEILSFNVSYTFANN